MRIRRIKGTIMKKLLLWPMLQRLQGREIFFKKDSDSKCEIVLRP